MTKRKFEIGIRLCDSMDFFIQTLTMVFPFVVIVGECKAIAMKHAFELALFNDFEKLSSKVSVNRLWMFCIMIICMRMSLILCSQLVVSFLYNIAYVRRQVNIVDPNLARIFLFESNPNIHYFYSPNYISSIILNEMQWIHFVN
jgi:hypothetical protein